MCRARVFLTKRVFIRPVFGKCSARPRVFADLSCGSFSSRAYMSSRRRGSSPDLSGSVFALPCVFATARVFARPVSGKSGKCLRLPASLRPTLSSEMSSLALGTCLRPPTCLHDDAVLARPVLGTCLHTPTCLRDDACLRPTCLRQLCSCACMASLLEMPWQGHCAREVSSDAHVSSHREMASTGVRLQTPTCLRCLRLACVY